MRGAIAGSTNFGETLGLGPAHVVREVHALEHANDSGARIDLTLSTPWRAQVGSTWCRLCQDSPKEGIASQLTLLERSRLLKGRLPNTWQIRVNRPGHVVHECDANNAAPEHAVRRRSHDQVIRPPMMPGSRNVMTTMMGRRY